jgi:[ribosomal protein S5]-alanine N-acetyltransferase
VLPEFLVTKRLVLRRPCEADTQHIFDAYTQDAEVPRYMTWRPHTVLAESEDFMRKCLSDWNVGHRRAYVLAFRDDPRLPIGMLDAREHTHIGVHAHILDLGYVLARPHWGLGLMPEAICTLTEVALGLPRFFRVQATCDVENHQSARALEKSGFVREARLERYIVHPNISSEPRACYIYARCR